MQETPWGFNGLGHLIFKRTYARRLKENDPNSPTEQFKHTVERELSGVDKQLKLKLLEEEKDFYRYMRLQLKGSVAGRFMWQLGTKTVNQLGLFSLQNCFGKETEFLTSEGIKSFEQFEDGDEILIRGRNSWVPATVRNYGEQQLFTIIFNKI